MRQRINPDWMRARLEQIGKGDKIDIIQAFLPCIQLLVLELSKRDIPYKLYNLGAGVKRLVTDTDTCPCCKRKFT